MAFLFMVVAGVLIANASTTDEGAYPDKPQVAIYHVLVPGRDVLISPNPTELKADRLQLHQVNAQQPLRFALNGQPIDFLFGPAANAPLPTRIRFRLEGLDDGWRDSGGHMLLHLGFSTPNNQSVESEMLERRGTSDGWSGRLASSRFATASIEATVPELADRLQIRLLCGHSVAAGIWGVRKLRVLAAETNGQWRVVRDLDIKEGQNLRTTQATPRDWSRMGNNWNVAKVVRLESGGESYALALVDNDPKGGGGWASGGTQVFPGQRIRVEWEEAYTIGQSGVAHQSYRNLSDGRYTFAVQATDESGYPVSPECRLSVTVIPPFYKTGWFWSATAFSLAMISVAGVRRSAHRRLEAQAALARQQHLITEERMRIARDLHDDLGAGLTQIALLIPQALRNGAAGTAAVPHLERVAKQARELVLALDQIVWAVNPGQDTLEGLASYLCDYAADLARDANLRFWPKVPTLLPKVRLASPTRCNLFSAAKEALNNVVRHSRATEVLLRFEYDPQSRQLEIEISDNGCGFVSDDHVAGNGIANIRSRLDRCGGTASIQQRPEGGTRVLLTLKVPEEFVSANPQSPRMEEAASVERQQPGSVEQI